jgi:hypothetical protein
VEHQGVRYTIRAGIEWDLWSVAIHPGDTESRARLIYGTREEAEFEARSMIDRWTQRITRRKQSRRKTAGDAERKQISFKNLAAMSSVKVMRVLPSIVMWLLSYISSRDYPERDGRRRRCLRSYPLHHAAVAANREDLEVKARL